MSDATGNSSASASTSSNYKMRAGPSAGMASPLLLTGPGEASVNSGSSMLCACDVLGRWRNFAHLQGPGILVRLWDAEQLVARTRGAWVRGERPGQTRVSLLGSQRPVSVEIAQTRNCHSLETSPRAHRDKPEPPSHPTRHLSTWSLTAADASQRGHNLQ